MTESRSGIIMLCVKSVEPGDIRQHNSMMIGLHREKP